MATTVLRYRSPARGLPGRAEDAIANAEGFRCLRRRLFSHLSFPVLQSDVRNIVYASWIVDTQKFASHVPPGVKVREVGGRTVLTLLAYDHGHFGPASAGPLRALCPSPRQANWRLYVEETGGRRPDVPTVLFLANVLDSLPYALGTRLFSDVMLSQRAASFAHEVSAGNWRSAVRCGAGAPSWHIAGSSAAAERLPEGFEAFYEGFDDAVAQLCLQDAAVAPVHGESRLAWSGIDLPIAVDQVRPLTVTEYEPCEMLRQWGAEAAPFCLHVPAVRFRVLGERLLAP